jgi:hypothetical protein
MALPYVMRDYINGRLNETPGYSGHVQDISLALLAGRVTLFNVELEKTTPGGVKPIISVKDIELALNWHSLWEGKPNTRILLSSPYLHFVAEKPKAPAPAISPVQAWRMATQQLLPLKIDAIYVRNGSVDYEDRMASPVFDIEMTDIQADLTGLQVQATSQQPLPANLAIQAKAFAQADTNLNLQFDPRAKTPTFKLEAQMEDLQLNQMNNFLQRYTKLKAQQGDFSFYLEAAAKQGKVTGYIKPFLQGLQTQLPKKDQDSVLKKAYKGVVQTANNILKNNDSKQVATQIDINGNINDPDASLWSVIVNLLQNAFIEAFVPGIDHSINT